MDGVFDANAYIYMLGIDSMYVSSTYEGTWKMMQMTKATGSIN